MPTHEGKASRNAMSLRQLEFSGQVQHVPAVELEREGMTEVQGREHPVRLG